MVTSRKSGFASGGDNRPKCPKPTRSAAQDSASADAKTTTRREAESAASSGTTTSQIAAKDSMPPVIAASVTTRPANASDESTCAPSYRPVRDKNHDSKIGATSHANVATSGAVGAPRIAR